MSAEIDLFNGQSREGYGQVREAAAAFDIDQMHQAAINAGLKGWLQSTDEYSLKSTSKDVTDALRMPFPSPVTKAWLTESGYPQGVETPSESNWSLALAEYLDPNERYDTGVRLVSCKSAPNSSERTLHFPLDITIPEVFYREALQRPDRVKVKIGERQLPNSHFISNEDAQRLLVVAGKFLEILTKGPESLILLEKAQGRRLGRGFLGHGRGRKDS